jgi:hypothetical protein
MVCGLNPSTADERTDDPTIRRCLGFANSFECGGLLMVNAFAWIETYSAKLRDTGDRNPVGEESGTDNDGAIQSSWDRSTLRVAAWGAVKHPKLLPRVTSLARLYPWLCFKVTKDGMPNHPLYLPKDASLRLLGGPT